ncbi:MAG TPA: hypothetical protein VLH84_00405 [Patescibacteria group bacterium]|nr:hypothetical protein [Patescibacteria group bacterium]
MVGLHKFNPMVRAIGTVGAIAALVGGITYASLQTDPVTLGPNTLTSATAALAIGAGTSCPGGNTTTTTGITASLVPGVPSAAFPFCLDNTGGVPLNITAQIDQSVFVGTDILPTDVTLTLTCPHIGTLSGTLDQYASPVTFPGAPLATASPENCTETATLASSFTGSNKTLDAFDISFVGNQ